MKKIGHALILIVVLINCQEPKDVQQRSQFSKDIGESIPNDVAERWVNRFKANTNASKIQNTGLSAAALHDRLTPLATKVGVLLHHATDNHGQHHILFIAVEEDQPLWSAQSVIDSNGQLIDTSIAKGWAEKYRNENTQGTWAHFFGIHVFDEILSKEGLEQVNFIPAINDQGRLQLLLHVWSSVSSDGRAEAEELIVYDKSMDCPPCDDI